MSFSVETALRPPPFFHFSSRVLSLPKVSRPSGTYHLLIFNFPLRRMTRVELPVLSFLAVLSLLFILPLHLKSRNIPFLFVIAWLLVCNIIQGVDAIVWANNALIRAEGWCDLGELTFWKSVCHQTSCLIYVRDLPVTPILYALRVALPAVALCVCRQLEIVSSTLDVSYDPRDKYFTSVFQYLMCLVIPVVYAILRESQTFVRFRDNPISFGTSSRFCCARSQIRYRAGIWVSSCHFPIGPSLFFDLAHPTYPLHHRRLLRRSFVLQLSPPLLVLQSTSQPSIQDDNLDVLPFYRFLPLRRSPHHARGHLRHGLPDRRIRTFGLHVLGRSSPRRLGLSFLKGRQVEIRSGCKVTHGSDLVDGADRLFRSSGGFRVHQGMLDRRRTFLYRRKEAGHRSVYSEAKV